MGIFGHDHNLVLTFGVLGNIVSIFVYLAPLPTFMQICRKKSTLGFQSLPYVVALFSAMLWMYYAFVKKDAILLISINSLGCIIETIYIILYVVYAPKEARKTAGKQIASLNVGLFSFILVFTSYAFRSLAPSIRISVVGWICVAISVSVFAAPLSIVFQVVRTRSVEFMPFTLSFFLTLSAIMWFAYGLFLDDWCIALPNVFGFILGLLQMLLYGIYRNTPKPDLMEKKLPEHIINMVMLGGPEVHPVDVKTCEAENENCKTKDEEGELERDRHDMISVGPPPEEPNRATVQLAPSPLVLVVCAA